jgi:hypothetical protein
MARGFKSGGRRRGTPNKRTLARVELQNRHGAEATSPALSQMRKFVARLIDLADEERRKGEEANQRVIRENLDSAARILREIAQYELPKLTAVRVGGDPDNAIPIDIKALSDDQLHTLIDRLSVMEKAQ